MAPGSSAVRERAATILQEKSQTWFEAREAVYCVAQRMNSISFMTRRAGVLFVETSICCSSRASLGFLCDMASSHGRFRCVPDLFFVDNTNLVSQTLVGFVERSKRDWYFYFKLVSRFNIVFVQSKHTSVNRFSI